MDDFKDQAEESRKRAMERQKDLDEAVERAKREIFKDRFSRSEDERHPAGPEKNIAENMPHPAGPDEKQVADTAQEMKHPAGPDENEPQQDGPDQSVFARSLMGDRGNVGDRQPYGDDRSAFAHSARIVAGYLNEKVPLTFNPEFNKDLAYKRAMEEIRKDFPKSAGREQGQEKQRDKGYGHDL